MPRTSLVINKKIYRPNDPFPPPIPLELPSVRGPLLIPLFRPKSVFEFPRSRLNLNNFQFYKIKQEFNKVVIKNEN